MKRLLVFSLQCIKFLFSTWKIKINLKCYIAMRRDSLNELYLYIKYFCTYAIKYQIHGKSLLVLNTNTKFKDLQIFT
jgi:hypothetical protein